MRFRVWDLSKWQNVFVQMAKCICSKIPTNPFSAVVDLGEVPSVGFVQMAKCICSNGQMYLSKYQTIICPKIPTNPFVFRTWMRFRARVALWRSRWRGRPRPAQEVSTWWKVSATTNLPNCIQHLKSGKWKKKFLQSRFQMFKRECDSTDEDGRVKISRYLIKLN